MKSNSNGIVKWLIILACIVAAGFIAYKVYRFAAGAMAAKAVGGMSDEVLRTAGR